MKHSQAPLDHQVKSLYDAFRTLRRRPVWKKRIYSGVWFFQIKRGKNDDLWHPHLHIICDGRYFPHDLLSRTWCDITHGSKIVDIRPVKDEKKAADYVSRYATSPCDLHTLSHDDAVAVFDAMHGRRVCGTFGNCRDLQLVPKKCPDSEDWEYLETFSSVMLNKPKSDWHNTIYTCFINGSACPCVPEPPPPSDSMTIEEVFYEPSTYRQFVFEFSNHIESEV